MSAQDTEKAIENLQTVISSYEVGYLRALVERRGSLSLPQRLTDLLIDRYGVGRAGKIYWLIDLFVRQIRRRPLSAIRERRALREIIKLLGWPLK